jgi:hypothetical protein
MMGRSIRAPASVSVYPRPDAIAGGYGYPPRERAVPVAKKLPALAKTMSDWLCVPKTSSALIRWRNHLTSVDSVRIVLLYPGRLGLAIKSKARLEAENAALRHQLIVLRRKVRGRVRLTNNDRWFLIRLYRWFPSILQALTIVRPETLVRWHRAAFRCYWRWKSRSRGRAAADRDEPPCTDPADEHRQSALGCAAHPRRTAQARVWGRAEQGPLRHLVERDDFDPVRALAGRVASDRFQRAGLGVDRVRRDCVRLLAGDDNEAAGWIDVEARGCFSVGVLPR